MSGEEKLKNFLCEVMRGEGYGPPPRFTPGSLAEKAQEEYGLVGTREEVELLIKGCLKDSNRFRQSGPDLFELQH